MSEKITGKIEWYNSSRGFGVIIGSDGEEYFVHTSRLSPDIISRSRKGKTRSMLEHLGDAPQTYHLKNQGQASE
jgi:cold shock CspA family protein